MRRSTAILVLTMLAVTACGTGGVADPGSSISTSRTAVPPDGQLNLDATATIRAVLEPTSLNPFATAGAALDQVLLDNVYQGLVSIDTGHADAIVPELAGSYDVSADGLTYTFHLVPNARFHDGAPLRASDVVWSLEQQTAPGSLGIYASSFGAVSAVDAPDPSTVRITVKQRDTSLLWDLAQRGGIVYKKDTDFASLDAADNGSGPFTVANWNRGSSITLNRYPGYWGAKPKVAKVVFDYIADNNTANNAQRTGQTDIETATDPTLLQPFTGNSAVTVLRGTTTDKYTLAFNDAQAPFANPLVRHAIRQAVNNNDIIKAVGAGTAIGSDVPPQDPWYRNLTGIDAYNPGNAKRLLAQAGYPNGLQLTLTEPSIYGTTVSDVLTSELAKVGITLTVKQVEFQTWLTQVFTGHQFQLSFVDHAEAHDLGNYADPKYYFGYDNAQVQQWYQQARTAPTEAGSTQLLQQAAKQVASDAASDWLYLAQTITVVRQGVYGVPQAETSNRYDLAALAVGK